MYNTINTFKKKLLLIAIIAAASIILLLPSSFETADAAPDQYYDTSGNMVNFPAGVIELNGTEPNLVGSNVWYYAKNNLNYAAGINVSGTVNLIIADDVIMKCQLTIMGGGTLTIYPQSDPFAGHAGILTWVGHTVQLQTDGNNKLINVAVIRNLDTIDPSMVASTVWDRNGANNSVTNYGIIHSAYNGIFFNALVCSVYNYGHIIGDNGYGIHMVQILINTGYIFGGGTQISQCGVDLASANSRIENSGTIKGNNDGVVIMNNPQTVINHPGGVIEGARLGIHINAGGTIDNYGTITGLTRGVYFNSLGTLRNYNEINGGVYIGVQNLTLTLAAGSVINGDLLMGTNTGSTIKFIGIPTGSPLTYTVVTGTTNLGQAIISIDDSAWVPPPHLRAGQFIVLIDGTGGGSVTSPRNTSLNTLGYTFPLSVRGGNQLVITTVKMEISLFDNDTGAALDETNPFNYTTVNPGYTPQVLNVAVKNSGNRGLGTGELSASIAGPNAGVFSLSAASIASIAEGSFAYFTVTPDAGLPVGIYKATITVSRAPGNMSAIDPVSFDISFEVTPDPIVIVNYFIRASSDHGSSISPSGTVTVRSGGNQTFRFSALEDHAITAVLVNGVPLTQSQIDSGTFTFRNVKANQTIEVRSAAVIFLEITIHGGNGHAEYSVNGRAYSTYTQVVVLPIHSVVSLNALESDEYQFKEWRKGTEVFRSSAISFEDVQGNLKLHLYFTGGTGEDVNNSIMWWILAIVALILLALFLFWFLFYHRRTYDVIKVARDVNIVGKDRVRRKKAYSFTIEGGAPGAVSYKVGEEGEWRMLISGEDGSYTIPAGVITDDVTVEQR